VIMVKTKVHKGKPEDKLTSSNGDPKRKPGTSAVWRGPREDGVTYSLLSRFLVDREAFRLYVVEGLAPQEHFDAPIEYGNMWHVCEEALAAGKDFKKALASYCNRVLMPRFAASWNEVTHWSRTCSTQFATYANYWAKNAKDDASHRRLLHEHEFNVAYHLPSGRNVILRGKWDSVDDVGGSGLWLQENKSKGRVDEENIARQLRWDLQTMIYVVALDDELVHGVPNMLLPEGKPFAGVRYNVIRRPFSGGKGSIRKLQPTKSNPAGESDDQFYARLDNDYFRAEPGYWFMRWDVSITSEEIKAFRVQTLDPILEQLCDWWEWITDAGADPWCIGEQDGRVRAGMGLHYRMPYGVYNPKLEGREADLDDYMDGQIGKESLRVVTTMFPELNGGG
jgi:hypothetical protein